MNFKTKRIKCISSKMNAKLHCSTFSHLLILFTNCKEKNRIFSLAINLKNEKCLKLFNLEIELVEHFDSFALVNVSFDQPDLSLLVQPVIRFDFAFVGLAMEFHLVAEV